MNNYQNIIRLIHFKDAEHNEPRKNREKQNLTQDRNTGHKLIYLMFYAVFIFMSLC